MLRYSKLSISIPHFIFPRLHWLFILAKIKSEKENTTNSYLFFFSSLLFFSDRDIYGYKNKKNMRKVSNTY